MTVFLVGAVFLLFIHAIYVHTSFNEYCENTDRRLEHVDKWLITLEVRDRPRSDKS